MNSTNPKSTIVIGGGWAGLAAATRLVQANYKVTLLERSKSLGGRASSFMDETSGEWLDNGPHLFIGAYRVSLGLLETWGALDGINFARNQQIPWIMPDGEMIMLTMGSGKLASAMGLVTFKGMSLADRFRSVKAVKAMVEASESDDKSVDHLTVAQFLSTYGIGSDNCGGFWEMLTIAVMNAPPKIAAVKPLITALSEGLLMGGESGRLGIATKPFRQLYCDPAEKYLTANGVSIRNSVSAKRIMVDSAGNVKGVSLQSGEVLKSSNIIVATPPHDLIKLLSNQERLTPLIDKLNQFTYSPITAIHINFSKGVTPVKFAALPNSLSQWFFKRGESGKNGYSKLSVVISVAPSKSELTTDELENLVLPELRQRLRTDAAITFIRTVRNNRATVVLTPEMEQLRPPVSTSVRGLCIAGDWSDTRLPATIESAAISGIQAAEEVIKQ